MNLRELRACIDVLIRFGVPDTLPVCLGHAGDERINPIEIDRISSAQGGFSYDPSPKLLASTSTHGDFVILEDWCNQQEGRLEDLSWLPQLEARYDKDKCSAVVENLGSEIEDALEGNRNHAG